MSLRIVQNRIRSIKNTSQITKAMEMVAASKMRKAQEFALNTRFYAVKAMELLLNLTGAMGDFSHYLLETPKSDKVCFLVVTSDKGLCGGFNSAVLNNALKEAKKYNRENVDIVAVGKRGAEFLKNKKYNVVANFSGFGDFFEIDETRPVARLLMEYQKNGKYKEVFVFYNKFISTLKQSVVSHRALPLDVELLKNIVEGIMPESGKYSEFRKEFLAKESGPGEIFEPSATKVAERLFPDLFEIEIHYVLLESNASEHSARMVAMKGASDNAKSILEELKLIYNKARQSSITKELSEISAGAEALK